MSYRVLLVSTNQFTEPTPVYPLALSYLKTNLEKRFATIDVTLFDFNLGGIAEFLKCIDRLQPDLVGISIRNIDTVNMFGEVCFIQENRNLIVTIRERTQSTIVVGGAGFSIFPESIFNLIRPDFAIFGEGEESLCQLVQALQEDKDYSHIQGLLYQQDQNVVVNSRTTYGKSPQPVFDSALVDYYWQTSGMLNLQTKRGCPYQCVYCTYPLIEGDTVRTHDPEQVVNALTELHVSKGINYFFFTDSVFNINNSFNRELAERIIAAAIDIQWGAYFTPHNLDLPLLKLLKKSGLSHIEFGTESLSDSTLRYYHKCFTVTDIFHASELCHQAEVFAAHFLILGGPGETQQSVEETIDNSNRIKKSIFFPFWGMRIYPQTKVYELAIAENKIEAGDSILEPVYYLADGIDYKQVKAKAKKTVNRWIFPDDNLKKPMEMMRKKGVKGPLWELLIK